jgi:TatD DNase family protein
MSPYSIIDTHCHIDVAAFDTDRDQVLQRARQNGVQALLVPGVLAADWPRLLDCCHAHPNLYPALGLHPVFTDQHRDLDLVLLQQLLDRYPVRAIGEIGLDYYIPDPDKERQLRLFEQQLRIAQTYRLPVLLHVRKAHNEVLALLRAIPLVGGIAHAFNGSLELARAYIELGFLLGFGGMLTYERSHKLRTLAKALPREALVLETDAPDMTVATHQGERNSPEYLPDCLLALAEAREEHPAQVAQQTTHNAEQLLAFALEREARYHGFPYFH